MYGGKAVQRESMIEGPVLVPMLRFALPIMLSGILQLLFNAADIMVVGQFCGETAVAAVGSPAALIALMVNLFVGISTGATVVAATDLGAGKKDISATVHTAYTLGIVFGLLTMIIGLIFGETFLRMMHSPADVIDQAALYLRIYFLGQPSFMIFTFGRAVLVPTGDTKTPLYYLTFAGVLNVIMNCILVVVFHKGVAGVAFATAFSQLTTAVLITRKLLRTKGVCRLSFRKLGIKLSTAKTIMLIGVPAGMQSVLFNLSNVLIQSSVNSLGTAFVAGNAAASTLDGFTYTAMTSVGQASMTFVGQNYGAGRFDRIKRIFAIGLALETAFGMSFGLMIYLFRNPILSLYLPDNPEACAAAVIRITTCAILHWIFGMHECTANVLRSIGKSVFPLIATICGTCVLRIGWALTVFPVFFARGDAAKSYKILLVSYPISWVLTFAAEAIYFIIAFRKLEKKLTS